MVERVAGRTTARPLARTSGPAATSLCTLTANAWECCELNSMSAWDWGTMQATDITESSFS